MDLASNIPFYRIIGRYPLNGTYQWKRRYDEEGNNKLWKIDRRTERGREREKKKRERIRELKNRESEREREGEREGCSLFWDSKVTSIWRQSVCGLNCFASHRNSYNRRSIPYTWLYYEDRNWKPISCAIRLLLFRLSLVSSFTLPISPPHLVLPAAHMGHAVCSGRG